MKKTFAFLAVILGIAPLVSFADASSTIQLPPGFIANMWEQFNQAFSGLSSLTYTVMGVLLALAIIESIILMIRK